jgi:hypothetical protein
MLHDHHPNLFARAVEYEEQHKDGRTYTWTQGETLLELLDRRNEIIAEHEKAMERELQKVPPNQPLSTVLESVLDEEDDVMPCLICHV